MPARRKLCPRRIKLLTVLALAGIVSWTAGHAEAVGRVAGDFFVTAQGAATYTIPFTVPAGANGLVPNIALSYNSQGGNGLAGMGWTLAGFSRIERCGLTKAVDGKFQGVQFTNEDRFCLDGKPLILTNSYLFSQYGANNSEYRTEVHNYEKIISKGSYSSASPDHFEVHMPNGMKYLYGNDADSQIETIGGASSEIRAWVLNEIIDKYDNRITFTYFEDTINGESYPTEVAWSSNPAQGKSAQYKLKFEYEDRSGEDDARSGYSFGLGGSIALAWQRTQRLERVRFQYGLNGNAFSDVHTYDLAYTDQTANGTGTRRSQLESVTQCGYLNGSANCLPTTTFAWRSGNSSWGAEVGYAETVTSFNNAVFGDIDGDGATDIFFPKGGTWHVLRGETFTLPPSGNVIDVGYLGPAIDTGESVNGPGYPLDYNGDGWTDLLVEGTDGYWHVLQSDGSTLVDLPRTDLSTATVVNPSLMDVDGDGLNDIVYLSGNSVYWSKNNGGQFAAGVYANVLIPADGAPISVYTNDGSLSQNDINGDGKDDLLVSFTLVLPPPANQTFRIKTVYLSVGNGFNPIPMDISNNASMANSATPLFVDINGDGLSDVAYVNNDNQRWYTLISQGDGFAAAVDTGILDNSTNQIIVVDYDRDGRQDIMRAEGSVYRVYTSDGNGFSSTRKYNVTGNNPAQVAKLATVSTALGRHSSLVLAKTDTMQWRLRTATSAREDMLVKATDGLGNTFEPGYKLLTDARVHAVSGTPVPPTTRMFRAPGYVVDFYDSNDGIGGNYQVGYTYGNGRVNMDGRGFLGFEYVAVTDDRDDIRTTTYYEQGLTNPSLDFPKIGRVVRQMVTQSSALGGDLISDYVASQWTVDSSSLTNGDPDPAGDYHFVYLQSDSSDEYELDGSLIRTTVRTHSNFDSAHGVTKTQTVDIKDTSGTTQYTNTRTLVLDSGLLNPAYCLGLPTKITDQRTDPVTGSATRVVDNTYYGTTCKLNIAKGPAGDAGQRLKTTLAYDGYGNLRQNTSDNIGGPFNEEPRITDIFYDSNGYRPIQEWFTIDATAGSCGTAGTFTKNFISRSWKYELGLEDTHTNIQRLSTQRTYDDFGRVTKTDFLGDNSSGTDTYTTVNYEWCSACFPGSAKYQITVTGTDESSTVTAHDAYGRVVGRTTALPNSKESRQATEHDQFGRVSRQNIPYLSSGTAYWVQNDYDLLGRRTIEDRPLDESDTNGDQVGATGSITTWAYAGLTTTVTVTNDSGSQTTQHESNLNGTLAQVTDANNGITQYQYTPFNQLQQITDPGSSVRSFVYDGRGSLTSKSDPDSGVWTFAYNVFGELKSQTDDKSTPEIRNRIRFDFDRFGRRTQRFDDTSSDSGQNWTTQGTTTWTYMQSGNDVGLLRSVAGPEAGYNEVYSYTIFDQVAQKDVYVDGNVHITNITYDGQHRLETMTYPTTTSGAPRSVFRYAYTPEGYFATVSEDGQGVIYTANDRDAFGRTTQATFGYGATTTAELYDFDQGTGRLKTIKTGAGANIQDYSYQWDQVGNLTQREDLGPMVSPKEVFTYDPLNRLTSSTLSGPSNETLSLTYAANGNITKKSDVGLTYTYTGSSGPHAVDSITGGAQSLNFAYDGNGNMTNRNGTPITWTSYNKPKQIGAAGASSTFSYGADRQRIKQVIDDGATVKTLYYIGAHFEVEEVGSNTIYRSHVMAEGRVVYSELEDDTESQAYYVHRDHLGSVDKLTALAAATGKETEFSFDAFGKRRNKDWTADETASDDDHWMERGYTGHEHLDNVKMIHMNGRVQEPDIGRMLSPDPVLGRLGSPQSLNPYSYAHNNPTAFTDPSGFSRLPSGIGATFAGDAMVLKFDESVARVIRWGEGGSVGPQPALFLPTAIPRPGPATILWIPNVDWDLYDAQMRAYEINVRYTLMVNNAAVKAAAAAVSGSASASPALTVVIAAQLSSGAYESKFAGAGGFSLVERFNFDNGLQAALFVNNGNYVLAFAGTDIGSWSNWSANFSQAFGFTSAQYEEGIDLAIRLNKEYGGGISFVGHSLGGGIASAAAIITGGSAITFNAAGVHSNTLRGFSRSNGSISAYYSSFDVLRIANYLTPARVAGNQISLGAAGLHGMRGVCRKLEAGC